MRVLHAFGFVFGFVLCVASLLELVSPRDDRAPWAYGPWAHLVVGVLIMGGFLHGWLRARPLSRRTKEDNRG